MFSSIFKPEIMTIISAVGAGGSFYYAFTTARKIEKSVQELLEAQRQFKEILSAHDNHITTYERKIEIMNNSLDRLKNEFEKLRKVSSGSSDIEAMTQIFDQIVQDIEKVNKNIPQELRKIRRLRKKKLSRSKSSKKKKSESRISKKRNSKKRNRKKIKEEEIESDSESSESSESSSEEESDNESESESESEDSDSSDYSSEEEIKKSKTRKSKRKKEKESPKTPPKTSPKKSLPVLNRKIEVSTFDHSSKNNETTKELEINPSEFFSQYD